MTLTRLLQEEDKRFLKTKYGKIIDYGETVPMGKIRAVVFENPVDIEKEIESYVKNYPSSVPKDANSYVVSDFNGGTQHVRKDGKEKEHLYSVYAIQFCYTFGL
jgi:hypothetical protein